MLKNRTFNREENVFCLLNSGSKPNMLFQARAVIKEIEYDDVNPKYKIQIVKFYDNFTYLRLNFFNLKFQYNFTDRSRPCKFQFEKNLKTVKDLENLCIDEKHWIIIDGLMVRKTHYEVKEMFETISDFLIVEKLRELKDLMVRASYKGRYRVDTGMEWLIRFKNLFNNKLSSDELKKLLDVL